MDNPDGNQPELNHKYVGRKIFFPFNHDLSLYQTFAQREVLFNKYIEGVSVIQMGRILM